MPTVVLVGTLDTKGHEYAFLADRVREHGGVVLVDAGIVGEPLATPDVARRVPRRPADVERWPRPAIAGPPSRRWRAARPRS